MLRPRISVCGKNLIKNRTLLTALQQKYQVDTMANFLNVEASVFETANVVLIELLSTDPGNLKFLRELKIKNADVSIIAVVDNGNVENTADIFYAGASDVFPKPIHYSLLIQRIEVLLKTARVT